MEECINIIKYNYSYEEKKYYSYEKILLRWKFIYGVWYIYNINNKSTSPNTFFCLLKLKRKVRKYFEIIISVGNKIFWCLKMYIKHVIIDLTLHLIKIVWQYWNQHLNINIIYLISFYFLCLQCLINVIFRWTMMSFSNTH
jgi:hypothetical protein